jgi:hypothetical protein
MKNIHILKTDKQIKNVGDLVKDQYGDIHIFTKNDGKEYGKTTTKLNIYITSDEEIKEGDWVLNISNNKIFKQDNSKYDGYTLSFYKKIIITTDQDLIKDGVQAIDIEFLEWFVKNPSCEFVDVYNDKSVGYEYDHYSIILPKKNFYCGDKFDYDEQCLEQCENCVDKKGIDYGYLPKEEPKNICIQTGLPCGMQCFSEEACNMIIYEQLKVEEIDSNQELFNYLANQLDVIALQSQLHDIENIVLANKEQQIIEEVFEWLTTNNYLTDLKETLIENFKNR